MIKEIKYLHWIPRINLVNLMCHVAGQIHAFYELLSNKQKPQMPGIFFSLHNIKNDIIFEDQILDGMYVEY